MGEVAFKDPNRIDEQSHPLPTHLNFDLVWSARDEVVLTSFRPQPVPARAWDVLVQKISEMLASDSCREVGSRRRVVTEDNATDRLLVWENYGGTDPTAPHAVAADREAKGREAVLLRPHIGC